MSNMSVLDIVAEGAAQWAIVDTLYFNSTTRSFETADIEIDGSRIGRILPPSTSRRAIRLVGDAAVCLPGLIDPDVGSNGGDWSASSQELVTRGVTAAGSFCLEPGDCKRLAGAEGIRRFLYVELGAHDASDGRADLGQAEWERFQGVVNAMTSNRCEFFPAVVPAKIGSAAALLAAASVAERLRSRLCIRLCATTLDAQRYKEDRFFTEVGLLSYLSLLTQATIFNLSQISRADVLVLNDSHANLVCAPGAINGWLTERHYAPLSLANRAIGYSSNGNAVAGMDWYASLASLSMALINKSKDTVEACDMVVDRLTRSAALALGMTDLGAIAENMRADLCIFDRPSDLREQCGSPGFMKLLATERPRHVLVGGTPVVYEGTAVQEMVES